MGSRRKMNMGAPIPDGLAAFPAAPMPDQTFHDTNHANHYKFDEGGGKVCYNTFIHPEAEAGKGGLVKIDKSVSVMYTQPAGAGPAKGPFCIGLGKLL